MKVYQYEGCSTCRQALRFLKENGIRFEAVSIVDEPPSVAELRKLMREFDVPLKKLFNTSGQLYRELKIGEKLPEMSESQALSLLASHGKLIKRPLIPTQGCVGFREEEWKKALL